MKLKTIDLLKTILALLVALGIGIIVVMIISATHFGYGAELVGCNNIT